MYVIKQTLNYYISYNYGTKLKFNTEVTELTPNFYTTTKYIPNNMFVILKKMLIMILVWIFFDPRVWDMLNSKLKDLFVEKGPIRETNIDYPKDKIGRHFSNELYVRN